MIKIPVFQDVSANFTQQIELAGQVVFIQLIWNTRIDSFFLTFTDQNGSEVKSIKLVANWPILERRKGFIEFDGDLMVRKTDTEVETEITYDNLGNGWDLFYLTEEEINQWKVDNGL